MYIILFNTVGYQSTRKNANTFSLDFGDIEGFEINIHR